MGMGGGENAMKDDRITIRFDPALGRKIRDLAKRRGLSVSDYCRLMCSLEVMDDPPKQPFDPVNPQLKETLADTQAFAQLGPQAQLPALRQAVDAVLKLDEATKQAVTWVLAVARAMDAYINQTGRAGRGLNASSGYTGGADTSDTG